MTINCPDDLWERLAHFLVGPLQQAHAEPAFVGGVDGGFGEAEFFGDFVGRRFAREGVDLLQLLRGEFTIQERGGLEAREQLERALNLMENVVGHRVASFGKYARNSWQGRNFGESKLTLPALPLGG